MAPAPLWPSRAHDERDFAFARAMNKQMGTEMSAFIDDLTPPSPACRSTSA